MSDTEYAIFETLAPPSRPKPRVGPTFRGPRSATRGGVGWADRPLDPPVRPNSLHPVQPTTQMRISDDVKEAQNARSQGKTVLRVPRMPVRLIPQFDREMSSTPGSPWGIEAVGAAGLLQGARAENVTVAILDTGIDAGHPAFAGLINATNYKDFTANGPTDNVGHGTHCAGIIFGRPVNGTSIGVAPGISKVLVGKIADKGFITTTKELRQAILWAVDNGAQIISLSVGLDFLGHKKALEQSGLPDRVATAQALNDYCDYTRFFDGLMQQIVRSGTAASPALVIAACGNDSVPADGIRVPATLPAIADNVIAVSALQKGQGDTFSVAPFCNSLANLCAPGVGILSAAPGGGLATMSGTSQAAPHVAAVAALWWQNLAGRLGGDPTPSAVREEIMGAARRDKVVGDIETDSIGRGLTLAPR